MEILTDKAKQARAEYLREWRKNMSPEQKEKRNEYQRKYYQEHKETIKQNRVQYWNKKAEASENL